MKCIKKIKGGLLLAVLLVILGKNTVLAAEYKVQTAEGMLYIEKGTEIFLEPDFSTKIDAVIGDSIVQVIGMTDNGYFQVSINGATLYIYGKGLTTSVGTQEHRIDRIDAKAALVGDADNGELIYAQNVSDRLAPASTTKILTALLVMEAVESGQIAWDTPVMVSQTALAGIPYDASHVNPKLKVGEVMNVYDLLQCVLIRSDCHACNVLGEMLSGSVDAFVARMNERAQMLGCTDTNFVNTSGYPDDNHYTNAYSLFLITREAMKRPVFQEIIAKTEIVIPATNLSLERKLENTNALIIESEYYNPNVLGGKTGSSISSGLCLVTAARNGGKNVITVILGAETITMPDGTRKKLHFSETNKLVEIGLDR